MQLIETNLNRELDSLGDDVMELSDKLDEALRKYAALHGMVEPAAPLTPFDPKKPWDYLFYLAQSDVVDGCA